MEHNANDGLRTSTEGMQHSVLVKVPVGLDKPGNRFVISAKDSHADREKGHRAKWALERNQRAGLPPIVYIAGTYNGVGWRGAWCRSPANVYKITDWLQSEPEQVPPYIQRNTPEGNGVVRTGVNGGFFNTDYSLIGHVGTIDGWKGNRMLIQRWNFGMSLTGSSRAINRMVLVSGTRATYTLHPSVSAYTYGFSGIGCLIWNGAGRSLDDDGDSRVDEDDSEAGDDSQQQDNDGDGQRNEDPDWPDSGARRPRTAVAWDNRGHFYLFAFKGDPGGLTWSETVSFFQTELPRWMREELPHFVRHESAYEGARISPQTMTIQDALMLDGGSRTQFIWRWAQRRRNPDGSWKPPIDRIYDGAGARVPTLVDAWAEAP